MSGSTRAFLLIVVGVLANNYVYLHDVIWSTNAGLQAAAIEANPDFSGRIIALGWLSDLGIAVTLAVIVVGLVLVRRALGGAEAS